MGSNPCRAIPKALKMVPVATLLGAQHYRVGRDDVTTGKQGFPGLKIESLRLPKCCVGLSNNNLEGPTGLLKIVKEFTF